MTDRPTRRSPIHHLLATQEATWQEMVDCAIVVRFDQEYLERNAMLRLGLCDASALVKLGVKGPQANNWLQQESVDVPEEIYESKHLPGGGRIVRVGHDEFLLESPPVDDHLTRLMEELRQRRPGVYGFPRQEATFLLTGSRAVEVLAETCSINWAEAVIGRLIVSRVAGVSCAILPEEEDDVPVYRLWVDPSYAIYLWEVLVEICYDLEGTVIGTAVACREL